MQAQQSIELSWEELFAQRTSALKPSEIREFLKLLGDPGIISFAGGIPDPALFPISQIETALAEIFADPAERDHALQYAASEGYAPLRQWIAEYMTAKGAPCSIDNILITTGSQQALDLIAKVLLDPGDVILTTAPTYLGALQAFNLYQPVYESVDTDDLRNRGSWIRAKLAYFVPDFANPSGESLTVHERQRVLEYSSLTGTPIIEDAAYEALRFEGTAEPSLLALDIQSRGSIDQSSVIYTGTFSKTIAPGFRVGWICAAAPVIQKIVLARQAADLHGSTLDQSVVQRVAVMCFDDQVRRLIRVYRRRRDAMLETLLTSMPTGTTWSIPQGGMFVWLTLPKGIDSRELLRESLATEKIIFVPGPSFFADGSGAQHIRLNYTRSDEATIVEGIQRLARLITRRLETSEPVGASAGTGVTAWSS